MHGAGRPRGQNTGEQEAINNIQSTDWTLGGVGGGGALTHDAKDDETSDRLLKRENVLACY